MANPCRCWSLVSACRYDDQQQKYEQMERIYKQNYTIQNIKNNGQPR
ncbi:hypothetical protein WAF17_03835 [Bernardetia sp. ABR2-2B]